MNESAREEFNKLRAMTPEELTPAQIDFLYARRSYLNKTDRDTFKQIILAKDKAVAEAVQA